MSFNGATDWDIESVRITAFVGELLDSNLLEKWIAKTSESQPLRIVKTPSSFSGLSR